MDGTRVPGRALLGHKTVGTDTSQAGRGSTFIGNGTLRAAYDPHLACVRKPDGDRPPPAGTRD